MSEAPYSRRPWIWEAAPSERAFDKVPDDLELILAMICHEVGVIKVDREIYFNQIIGPCELEELLRHKLREILARNEISEEDLDE